MSSFLYVYSDHSILECYNLFSGVELSMRSFFVIPWRQKRKGKTFSDHNAMDIQFKVSRKSYNNVEKRNDHVVWNFNNLTGWKNFHANTEENHSLNKIWLEDVSVQHAYKTWENKVNGLLHKCFKKKRMVTVLGNRYNKMIWLLLTEEKVLKKSLRTIESNKKRKKKAKQLKCLQSYIHEEISNYNFKLVSRKIDNSGTLSKNDFWKIKKKLFPKSHSVPHAILDKVGNELTDPQNIILAYRNEMFHRLQKRLFRANLKDYESAMNQLCRHRLHKATTTHSPDFSLSEVRNAISELKEGRCIDPTGFVREIFTRAGTGLVQSIVTMLNMIKKKWQVPSRWAEMYICTLYKQKGSWKELENHWGNFIVVIVSIIFEKVLKNRITPILRENMTKFQTGGIKGKGVVDNLFIMRALISHSLYVNINLCF